MEDKIIEPEVKIEKTFVPDEQKISDMTSAMPEVVPDALAAAQEKIAEQKNIQAEYKDNKGRPFNPDIHDSDPATGIPKTTNTGRFKMKARPSLNRSGGQINLPPQNDQAQDMKIKNAAAKYADIFIVTGISLCGDGWKPEISKDYNERQQLIDANERWMIEYGYVEPPAWVDLLLAYGFYAGKRIVGDPKTKNLFNSTVEKIKLWGYNLYLKITGQNIKVVKVDDRK